MIDLVTDQAVNGSDGSEETIDSSIVTVTIGPAGGTTKVLNRSVGFLGVLQLTANGSLLADTEASNYRRM